MRKTKAKIDRPRIPQCRAGLISTNTSIGEIHLGREHDQEKRRAFNAEFKLHVVQIIREQGLSVGDVCRDLKHGETAVRRWLAQADEEAAGRPGIGLPLNAEQQRTRHLEAENKQLRGDVDVGAVWCKSWMVTIPRPSSWLVFSNARQPPLKKRTPQLVLTKMANDRAPWRRRTPAASRQSTVPASTTRRPERAKPQFALLSKEHRRLRCQDSELCFPALYALGAAVPPEDSSSGGRSARLLYGA